jgi:hypothetical protein
MSTTKQRHHSIGNDICRCMDSACPARFECLRYLLRTSIGDRTPVTATLRGLDGCNSLSRVDKGEWVRWRGGECPVEPSQRVQVLFGDMRMDNATNGTAVEFGWSSDVETFTKIVAFRLIPD